MRKLLFGITFLCLSVLLVISCKHELPIPIDMGGGGGTIAPPPSGNPCSPDSVYFQNTILPLITSNCSMSGCHDAVSKKEGLILTSYTGIMRIVKAGNANGSKLVSVITTTDPGAIMPPPPMAKLTTAQIDAIKKWINQGAKNNSCTAACDTAIFTFSGSVKSIMTNKCVGCHTGASAGGGVDLSTYNGVKASATAGTLLGSVQHKAGYKPMPVGGTLPACEVTQIQKWIAAGALNN